LQAKHVTDPIPIIVATPNIERDILPIALRDHGRKASCCFKSWLGSLPFPEPTVFDGCSERLGKHRHVARWGISIHVFHLCTCSQALSELSVVVRTPVLVGRRFHSGYCASLTLKPTPLRALTSLLVHVVIALRGMLMCSQALGMGFLNIEQRFPSLMLNIPEVRWLSAELGRCRAPSETAMGRVSGSPPSSWAPTV